MPFPIRINRSQADFAPRRDSEKTGQYRTAWMPSCLDRLPGDVVLIGGADCKALEDAAILRLRGNERPIVESGPYLPLVG